MGDLREPNLKVPTEYESATYPQTKYLNGITYEFVGWYDNEEFTGVPMESIGDFSSYQVTKHTTFYGKYVPKDTIEEDQPFITVEKHITGIEESLIDMNFYVKVGNYYLNKNTAKVEKKDGTIILRWTIPDVGEGTYDIGEANQGVEGYIVKQGGDFGSNVEVKAKTFTVSQEGQIIHSCSNRDLKVGDEGDYNFIFVVSENGNNKKNVVISKEPLSLSQRNAVVNALNAAGSTFANQNTVFTVSKTMTKLLLTGQI